MSRLPILTWARGYGRETASNDLIAALIVTVMLIPQSLAYAMLAGMPPVTGLYASMLPLIAYTVLGSSRTLAVGPVAVASLMTAAAVGQIAEAGSAGYATAAVLLAFMSGAMLLVMGALRLGFLAAFLSHPVIAGFITASGLIIAAGQLAPLLGIKARGQSLTELIPALWSGRAEANLWTALIGILSLAFLYWARLRLRPLLERRGWPARRAGIAARIAPVFSVIAATAATWGFDLGAQGVKTVGVVPTGLPALALPSLDVALWTQLAVPALMISIVGYVETISVAQTLAAKRRQKIDPDQELTALGASNVAAALSGGFPVTGGFARSVVNFDAGAETPAAGAMTALLMALATAFLTPLITYLPQATLAATIIVAVLSLVDFGALRETWAYSRGDGAAMAVTILATLGLGVETGLIAGVALSLGLYLWRLSRPHVAVVGQVPGTEHFRNVARHDVVTVPEVVTIRVDESLAFPNARFLETRLLAEPAANPALTDIVLMCPAVNSIDSSALEALESANRELREMGVRLHLSEVKGPVMDRLRHSHFLHDLTGRVWLTQFDAMAGLAPEVTLATRDAVRVNTEKARG